MKIKHIWILPVFIVAALAFALLYTPAGDKQPSAGVMRSENLGGLRIDMAAQDVIELLGESRERGEQRMSESDALYHQEWRYPRQGILLDMVSEQANDNTKIASIRVGPPSSIATGRGVKVGDSFTAVNKAYSDQLDADNSDPPFTLLAGSLYDGILFSFEEGKVIRIYLGAVAE